MLLGALRRRVGDAIRQVDKKLCVSYGLSFLKYKKINDGEFID